MFKRLQYIFLYVFRSWLLTYQGEFMDVHQLTVTQAIFLCLGDLGDDPKDMNLWEVGQVKTTPGSLTYGKKHHLLIGNLWHNIQNTMQQYRTYMTVLNIHHSFQASLLHVGERIQLLSQVLFLFLYYTDCWWRMPTRSPGAERQSHCWLSGRWVCLKAQIQCFRLV